MRQKVKNYTQLYILAETSQILISHPCKKNKPGRAYVGAPLKAPKAQKNFGASTNFFRENIYLTVPKLLKKHFFGLNGAFFSLKTSKNQSENPFVK